MADYAYLEEITLQQLKDGYQQGTYSIEKVVSDYLKRIEDIDAEERSILGAWTGKEWRYENNSEFISTKENLALGSYKDGKHCLLIYRLQESTSGRRLADKSLLIRFDAPKK